MNSEYLQRPNESFMDWKVRLIVNKIDKVYDIDWTEIVNLLKLDCSGDHLRKTSYGIYEMWKYQEENLINQAEQEEQNELINNKSTIEIHGDGKQTSDKLIKMSEEQSKDIDFLLKAHGFNSKFWELVSARNNIWNAYSKVDGIQTLYSSKVTVKPRTTPFDIDWVKAAFKELDNYPSPIVKNKHLDLTSGKLLEINLADVHLNKLCFASETGSEYNHAIAEERLLEVIQDIINRTKDYKFEKVLLPVGQDFLNIDSPNGTTTKGTRQDTSQRYPQMFKLGVKVFSYIIDQLSEIAPVEVFYVGGNHDKMLSYCLVIALSERYRNNENVNVDESERLRKYYEFGENLIGFAHGDGEKSRIGKLMPIEVPQMWGRTKYREMHCSHLHKELLIDEQNGLIVRRISSISGTDAWSYESGFIGSVKKAQSFVYDKEHGLELILNSVVK